MSLYIRRINRSNNQHSDLYTNLIFRYNSLILRRGPKLFELQRAEKRGQESHELIVSLNSINQPFHVMAQQKAHMC